MCLCLRNIISYLNYTFSFALLYRIGISIVLIDAVVCVCVWSRVEDFLMIKKLMRFRDRVLYVSYLLQQAGSFTYDIFWAWPIESTQSLSCFKANITQLCFFFVFRFVNATLSASLSLTLWCFLFVSTRFYITVSFPCGDIVRLGIILCFHQLLLQRQIPGESNRLFSITYGIANVFVVAEFMAIWFFITLLWLLFFCGQTQNDTVKKRKCFFFSFLFVCLIVFTTRTN